MPILKNPRHEAVAQNLAKGMSADAAYKEAGYRPDRHHAARLATKGHIRERVKELLAPALEEAEVTVERVVKELACLAFYNPIDVLERTEEGELAPVADPTELPEDVQRAIVAFTPVRTGDRVYYRIKMADKLRALEALARHLQMFKDTVVVENVFKVIQEMSDEELDRRLRELEEAIEENRGTGPPAPKDPPRLN